MLEGGEAFLEQAWLNQRKRINNFTTILDFRDHTNNAQMVMVFCQLHTPKAAIISLAFYAGILEVQTPHLRDKKNGEKTQQHKSFSILMKDTPLNLLGRDRVPATKYSETRGIRFWGDKQSSLPLKGRPENLFFLSNKQATEALG